MEWDEVDGLAWLPRDSVNDSPLLWFLAFDQYIILDTTPWVA